MNNGRLLKYAFLLIIALSFFLFAACSENRGEELFKTAQFEELQNNQEHAEKLYREIVEKYPKSSYAVKAEERLSDLNK